MNDDFMCPVCKSAPLITDYCPNCSRIGGYTAPPDAFPQAHRLALELECLLLSCTDTAATAKWWDSAHEALEQWRQFCAVEPPAVDSHWPKINMDISDKGAAPLQITVEAAINQLVAALQESKGWMRDYADAIIRGAIDRTTPPLPDEVREMVVDLRCFEHPNHTGESLMQKAADLIERLSAERDSYKAMLKEQWAAGVPPDCVVVPREPTEVMMKAYLGANKAYWFEYDKIEAPIGKWCAGTVQQAFEASYKAMIAAGEVKP